MKAKYFFFVLALAGQCHAGYSASITNGLSSNCVSGKVSACYLTAGMAMTAVCNYGTSIVSVDAESKTYVVGTPYGSIAGSYGICNFQPNVIGPLAFAPGYVDPSIGSDGSVSGTGSGSSAGASSELVTTLQTTVTALQGQLAAVTTANIQNAASISQVNAVLNEPFDLATALAATGFFFSSVLGIYAVSKAAGSILVTIKQPMRRY